MTRFESGCACWARILRYVSRGGLKLEKALEHWQIDLGGKVCLDIGASTGGFSDCMLQHGAAKVIAVDTGYGQMDFGLRNDPRIRLLEKTNARYLEPGDIGEPIDFIAMDVSFISATLVLPAVIRAARALRQIDFRPNRQIVVLVKPQFEAGREQVGKGGIVRDESAQRAAVARVEAELVELGCTQCRMDRVSNPWRRGQSRIPASRRVFAACHRVILYNRKSDVRMRVGIETPEDMPESPQNPTRQKTVAIISKPDRPELSRSAAGARKMAASSTTTAVVMDQESAAYFSGVGRGAADASWPRGRRIWLWCSAATVRCCRRRARLRKPER